MKRKRKSRGNAIRRNSANKNSLRKVDQNGTTESQEKKVNTRFSAGMNRTNSLEKETTENFENFERGVINNVEIGTKRNSRNIQIGATEKNVYNNDSNNNNDNNDNAVSSAVHTRRSTPHNMRGNKEVDGDTKKMKDYVVTRSVSSKRESLKSNKNVNLEKDFADTTENAELLKMESQQGSNINSNVDEYSEVASKSKDTANVHPYSQNKETGKRESKKRERKEDDTYKTYIKEKDVVNKQRRQDRKTNHMDDEIYAPNNETTAQLNKEQVDKNIEKSREMKKEGRVLRGRKETHTAEKEKRGRGHYSYGQSYYNEADKKNVNVSYTKDGGEVEGNYEQSKDMSDAHKYNGDVVVIEKEKSRDRRREKQNNVNANVEKPVERTRKQQMKSEADGVTKKNDKASSGVHDGRDIKENGEDLTKRGKSGVGKEKKEMTVEAQHRVDESGKYNGEVSAGKGITKDKHGEKEEKEKLEKGAGKENEIENKDDDLLKSSYIKNGRVLRNLNRYNASNDNNRTNAHRNTRNDKSEVSLCNIITSRRKRKNTEIYAEAPENEKNKQNVKTNNTANNTSRRKTKKGKRNTRKRVTYAANTATKVTTRNTAARNANTGAGKTNAAVSQHNEKRGNHVAVGTSDVIEEHSRHRGGAGAQNYTNQSGRVNVATATDPYNLPVSHSTRFRERQVAHFEEPEQKKRKKRVTEEGSKESSKINVGENYQVQTLPTFFLCRPELVYNEYDNSDSDDKEEQCFECAGLPCHCRSGEPKLVYSPLMLERVKERCLKSRGYHKCVKNEMELSAYVQECAKLWKTNADEWIPFSPEYAYKLLHYANYDPLKAISIMKSRDFSFRRVLDPPTRKYQNKWKPKDKRDQLSKSPFPSPLTIRNYLSKRHHNSGYHLR